MNNCWPTPPTPPGLPGQFPLVIYHGDSYNWEFRLWSDAAKTIPIDLTGVTAKSEIRDQSGGSVIVPLTCTITVPNIINAALIAVNSQSLTISSGVWDLQLTYPDGSVTTILAGPVSVTADVTDSVSSTLTRVKSGKQFVNG
jgi:hypothetical protein